MLYAVFSDSHGNTDRMISVLSRCRPDAVIFLGDGVRDIETVRTRFPALLFHIVRGNCDGDVPGYEDSIFVEQDGVRIFCTHGHIHGVRFGLDKFGTSVLCSGAVLGLYGHTHRPVWQEVRGIQLMNPGSIGDALHPTYGLVEVRDGAVHCRILDAEEN